MTGRWSVDDRLFWVDGSADDSDDRFDDDSDDPFDDDSDDRFDDDSDDRFDDDSDDRFDDDSDDPSSVTNRSSAGSRISIRLGKVTCCGELPHTAT